LLLVIIAPVNKDTWTYPNIVLSVPNKLKGNAPITEIAQDIYGFRALIFKLDPYESLHDAIPLMGANWQDDSPTTHPPTAFLFTAPIAFLPLKSAFAIWAWLMIAAVIFSLRAYHFSWQSTIILGILSVLWPPVITSLGNNPCIWMFALAIAYHQRNRNSFLAGIWIGVASFTKLLPAIMLIPFLIKKKWSTLAGFILSWVISLSLIFVLLPSSIVRYYEVNKIISPLWIGWIGNGSPLVFLLRYFGLSGFGIGLYILLIMVFLNWRTWINRNYEITSEAWHLFSFVAVILLPIAWTYSIAPLFPSLLILAKDNSPKRLLGFLALASPIVAIILGIPSSGVIMMVSIPYCLYWILAFNRPSLFLNPKSNFDLIK
jgi:hypothetical protein